MTGNPVPPDDDVPWNPIIDEDSEPADPVSLEDVLGDGLPDPDDDDQ